MWWSGILERLFQETVSRCFYTLETRSSTCPQHHCSFVLLIKVVTVLTQIHRLWFFMGAQSVVATFNLPYYSFKKLQNIGVPIVAHQLWNWLVFMGMLVWFLALPSGLRIPVLLWLWLLQRLATAAPIQPLAWELPYAIGAALKSINKYYETYSRKNDHKQIPLKCLDTSLAFFTFVSLLFEPNLKWHGCHKNTEFFKLYTLESIN